MAKDELGAHARDELGITELAHGPPRAGGLDIGRRRSPPARSGRCSRCSRRRSIRVPADRRRHVGRARGARCDRRRARRCTSRPRCAAHARAVVDRAAAQLPRRPTRRHRDLNRAPHVLRQSATERSWIVAETECARATIVRCESSVPTRTPSTDDHRLGQSAAWSMWQHQPSSPDNDGARVTLGRVRSAERDSDGTRPGQLAGFAIVDGEAGATRVSDAQSVDAAELFAVALPVAHVLAGRVRDHVAAARRRA